MNAKARAMGIWACAGVMSAAACRDAIGPKRPASIIAVGRLTAAFRPASAAPGQSVELQVGLPLITGTASVHVIIAFGGVAVGADTAIASTAATAVVASFSLPQATTPGELAAEVKIPEISQSARATLTVVQVSGQ